MSSSRTMPFGAGLPPSLRIGLRIWLLAIKSARGAFFPFLDLALRASIALTLLRSALVKLADWDVALALATYEYPVAFMAPATAAALGAVIELVGGILLLTGAMTRSAALAVAALLCVSQFSYTAIDANIFAIALLAWLIVHGAGALSFDRLLRPGLTILPLPLLGKMQSVGDGLRQHGSGAVLLVLRWWLAVTLLVAAGMLNCGAANLVLPLATFMWVPPALAIAIAVALLIGLGTAATMLLLLLAGGGMQAMGLVAVTTAPTALLLGLLVLKGAGWLSLDTALAGWADRHLLFERRLAAAPDDWPHIVVIGGGFGGLACVAALKRLPVRITLIDRNNYHLFQPLLYQVASAALSPADIAMPIRSLFRDDGNVRVLLGEVDRIDRATRRVHFGRDSIAFDTLVVATGASHSYFGKDQWSEFAPGLKRIGDAIAVRSHVLRAFEAAEASDDADQVRRLMTFVVVGGGPTGVELAGAIAELSRLGLRGEYRAIDPAMARIILIQSAPRLLPAFAPELSDRTAAALGAMGVDVRLNARVTDIAADHVMVGDTRIATETVLWAAGVVASPAGAWLNAATDAAGRVVVNGDLSIADDPDIFVIGDTAASMACAGQPVPGLAPAAKQAGHYVAHVLRARLSGATAPAPFAYRHQGSLATIGRKAAVADFGRLRLHGAAAWWLWGLIHVGFLVGARNRATVMVNWAWNYFTQRLGIGLITAVPRHGADM